MRNQTRNKRFDVGEIASNTVVEGRIRDGLLSDTVGHIIDHGNDSDRDRRRFATKSNFVCSSHANDVAVRSHDLDFSLGFETRAAGHDVNAFGNVVE